MGFQGASLADRLGAMARREDELMLAGIIRTCGKAREWQAAAEMDVPVFRGSATRMEGFQFFLVGFSGRVFWVEVLGT